MNRLFHYSKAIHLSKICKDRILTLATAGVIYDRPAVWCSTRPDFEPTAACGKLVNGALKALSFREMAAIPMLNPIRIEVEQASCPLDWNDFLNYSGINDKLARALENEAFKVGSRPLHWRLNFEPIPSTQWISIGYFYEQKWRRFDANEEVLRNFASFTPDDLRLYVKSLCQNKTK